MRDTFHNVILIKKFSNILTGSFHTVFFLPTEIEGEALN